MVANSLFGGFRVGASIRAGGGSDNRRRCVGYLTRLLLQHTLHDLYRCSECHGSVFSVFLEQLCFSTDSFNFWNYRFNALWQLCCRALIITRQWGMYITQHSFLHVSIYELPLFLPIGFGLCVDLTCWDKTTLHEQYISLKISNLFQQNSPFVGETFWICKVLLYTNNNLMTNPNCWIIQPMTMPLFFAN